MVLRDGRRDSVDAVWRTLGNNDLRVIHELLLQRWRVTHLSILLGCSSIVTTWYKVAQALAVRGEIMLLLLIECSLKVGSTACSSRSKGTLWDHKLNLHVHLSLLVNVDGLCYHLLGCLLLCFARVTHVFCNSGEYKWVLSSIVFFLMKSSVICSDLSSVKI